MSRNSRLLVIFCLSLAVICGCQVATSFNAGMTEPHLARIAVMPFEGPADKSHVAEMVRRAIYDNLSVLGFADIKLSEVDYRLAQAGIGPDTISAANAAQISPVVDADALLFGKITKATNLTAIAYSETQIGGEFFLVDGKSGEIIWHASNGDGERGGALLEALCVVETIESQIANSKKEEAYHRAADKLARKVINTLPDVAGERMATAPLPEIMSVRTSAEGRRIEPGKELVVVMNGSPGMAATMNICGVEDYIPMTEAPAGVYTGAYTLKADTGGAIVCRVEDRSGKTAQKTVYVRMTVASK